MKTMIIGTKPQSDKFQSYGLHIADAIKYHQSVFKRDILIFELFSGYIVRFIGPVTYKESLKLFKYYCKPIKRKGDSSNARDPKVLVPQVHFKCGYIVHATERKRYIYTCRDVDKYNSVQGRTRSVLPLKKLYNDNYAMTIL